MLSLSEQTRYQKHLLLPQFGAEGQEKLKAARVLVVGAGGLGCPVLLYLTAAGVGKLGVIDPDTVDLSNLQRQVLYRTDEVGQPKVLMAVTHLKKLNDQVEYAFYHQALRRENATQLIQDYDVVVDCTDNFTVRYLINDVCVSLGKPFVYGAIHQFEGQVSVFNFRNQDGKLGPTYRCLFPQQPSDLTVPNCAEVGVIGVLPGLIGMYQASEVVKMLTGVGKVLTGELLLVDVLENTQQKVRVKRRPDAEKLIFPEPGAELVNQDEPSLRSITVADLHQKLEAGEDIFVLDVRNLNEYDICHLPQAVLIPMNTIPNNVKRIPQDRPVVVHCHHGTRSANVIQYLQQNHGFRNLYNLEGGIDAWARQVDETMAAY
ncbi:MAG: molybdopterin-synthase adenylyltransferase MoeB [Cytophagaceae bacterium]|nr:molybdopterin-synthase adenylyltransferase MoeB [Cytophagaceae bacterium]